MKSSIFRSTIIYTLTDGLSKALSFLVLPFISYYLIPEQLGIVANFDVLQSIVMLLAGQAIVNGLPYFYYERSHEKVAVLVSNLIYIIVFVNLAFSLIIILLHGVIEEYLYIGIALQFLTLISVVAQLISNINSVLYRLEEKPFAFARIQILQTIIYLSLLVYLVFILKMEAVGKIYSFVISCACMSLFNAYLLYKRGYIVWKYSRNSIKELLHFGIPLLPHSLSFWLKGGMDKVLLTTYCGLGANGLYSMAMSFGAIYAIFNTAFSNAYVPYLQKKLNLMTNDNGAEEKAKIVRNSYKIACLFILLYFIVVGICWVVIYFVLDHKYKQSFQFVPWILLALTFNAFYSLVIQYPYSVKKTFGLGIITFICSIVQLALTYFLIILYGMDGIKYSLVLGAMITMIGVWWYSNRVYPMPWFKQICK